MHGPWFSSRLSARCRLARAAAWSASSARAPSRVSRPPSKMATRMSGSGKGTITLSLPELRAPSSRMHEWGARPAQDAPRRRTAAGWRDVQLTRLVRLGRIRITAVAKRMIPAWRYFGCLNMAACLLLLWVALGLPYCLAGRCVTPGRGSDAPLRHVPAAVPGTPLVAGTELTLGLASLFL